MISAFAVLLGACGSSDLNRMSVNSAKNSIGNDSNPAAGRENKSDQNKKSGGQLTIVSGADKSTVKIRSTRFT